MTRSVAEELLVLTADERGRLQRTEVTEALVGGAVLAELIVTGVVSIEPTGPDASVVRATSASDAARLGTAVDALSGSAVLTPELVEIVGWAAYDVEVERLLASGMLVHEPTRFLGLVPRVYLRLVQVSAAEDAWADLRRAMGDPDGIDRRIATMIALLDGVGALDDMIGTRASAIRPRSCGTPASEKVAGLLREISSVAGAASAAATAAAAATPSLR
ncbi:GPP34 family phosphoprotein [Microbacterium sp. SLBN-146]|uniref:GOLPH3/VPS74 family protein n=1 Tax=Microbacterium sp. SLBN-146 TaxID=2768457 RepID=UPI00114D9DD1|nr:GPP34 family phosphoprotein [Microbacterium sp. SLBN-146]TQJ32671.1 Golgi phosphoprotein 3 GPP34 [Microbacterium sp. SLBN-146]